VRVAILYSQLYDLRGERLMVGGIESYLQALGRVCQSMGWEPFLFQAAHHPFERQLDGMTITGVPGLTGVDRHESRQLLHAAEQRLGNRDVVVVFGDFQMSLPLDHPRCVSVQHGIYWDLPRSGERTDRQIAAKLRRGWRRINLVMETERILHLFDTCPNRVCVDYNFVNWYRSMTPRPPQGRVWVIPNFTSVATAVQMRGRWTEKRNLRVLFARRFWPYRGTRLMVEVTKTLLRRYDHVNFTFAGEGPDEEWMRRELAAEARVSFIRYAPADSLAVHLAHDICVVPSLGSEGTSLSVAEALGAGCAVVATNIGGVTNMIIDGYNGLLVMPAVPDLTAAVDAVIRDSVLRERLGQRALETAATAFSFDAWAKRWQDVLTQVSVSQVSVSQVSVS